MTEADELVTAMAAVVIAAVMLVPGGLYIDSKPVNQTSAAPANPHGIGDATVV